MNIQYDGNKYLNKTSINMPTYTVGDLKALYSSLTLKSHYDRITFGRKVKLEPSFHRNNDHLVHLLHVLPL